MQVKLTNNHMMCKQVWDGMYMQDDAKRKITSMDKYDIEDENKRYEATQQSGNIIVD